MTEICKCGCFEYYHPKGHCLKCKCKKFEGEHDFKAEGTWEWREKPKNHSPDVVHSQRDMPVGKMPLNKSVENETGTNSQRKKDEDLRLGKSSGNTNLHKGSRLQDNKLVEDENRADTTICSKCGKPKDKHLTGWRKRKEYCSFYPNIHFEPTKTDTFNLSEKITNVGGVINGKELTGKTTPKKNDPLDKIFVKKLAGDDLIK